VDETILITYLNRRMRFLLALLALLSGFSVPQAVSAAATGRVDSGVVASQSVTMTPMRRTCAARCIHAARPSGETARKPVWLPTVAFAGPSAIHFGDRARE
jgi:hypothetical protein